MGNLATNNIPILNAYDDFNVMTNMTTYRNESLQSGDTTTWLYDEPTGLLTNKVYADGKGPTYTYTLDGKLATRTWARGITTDYSYDGWGNLRNTVYSYGTPAILLFYDALGRQTEAHDAAGVTTFFYDMYGTLTNEAVRCTRGALAAWQGQETTNVVSRYYDSFGRNTGYAINGVRQSTLSYDLATGRLATMLANGSNTPFAWSYLPGSDLKSSLAYPNGLTASWTYDSNNQLLQVCNAFPTNVISQYDYTYDSVGRRIEIARSGSAMSGNRTDSYGYNVRDELISATKTGGTASVPSTTEYAYQYDDIGNRISSFDLGTNRTYTANNLNQYFEISTSDAGLQTSGFEPQYDDDGNQTLIQTSTGIWTVTYNGENRPVLWERTTSDTNTQTLISMSYDRMGRRVSYLETCGSTTNAHKVFTYDGYLQIANSELTTQTSQLFIWDPTEPVATRPLVFYNSDASPQYYTHDGNKNVSGLADSTQSITAHYAYTPFGSLHSSSGASALFNPFRFSSEYADDALGLVYYNYRHYNPEIGRWMRRDPLWGLLAGYCYCFNNTARFDFRGLYEKYSFEDSRVVKMQKNSNTFGAAKTFSVFKRMKGDKYERTVEKLSDEECETMKKQTSFFMARYSKSSNSRNIERVPCSKKCPCYRAIVRRPHITVKPILVFKGGEGYDENNPDDYTWVLENRVDGEVLLAHENIHWAITQKIAADAIAKVRSLYGRALSCEANSAVIFAYDFLEEKIEKAMNEYGDLWSNLQNRIDRETEHGDDYNKEKEWEEDPQWR